MKKLLIGCIALLAVGTANAKGDIDKALLQNKIVDSNYKYINLPLAKAEFKKQADLYNSKKISPAQGVKVTFIEFTPYSEILNLNFLRTFTDNQISQFQQKAKSPDAMREACQDAYFNEKYLSANNVNVVYNYFDINNKPLFSVKLNNQTCS